MASSLRQYKLSCQLIGHTEDVRGICVCGDSGVATGSRDKSIRVWTRVGVGQKEFVLAKTLVGHTSFVGPVTWITSNEELPSGGLVSGGMDTTVMVWDLETAQAIQTLRGHALQVTSVLIEENGDILSASVDSTVRRWRQGQTVDILQGHEGPVQAVLKLPSGEVVTGSSDSTIRIWRGDKCINTLRGHSDTVRGLALMPNLGFLSASHDGSVKLWSNNGEQLLEMIGHTAIIYGVSAHTSGDVASGSEDGFAKIWRDGMCSQSLQHPGCVWDVKFLANGDLLTACSDGVARVWTVDPERYAPAEEVEAYELFLATRQNQGKIVGGVNVRELPGLEALQQPGTNDGQTKIIREGDTAVAYSWNNKEFKWEKVGEVVDGPENSVGGKVLNGVTYDHVFDVDIGDGEPTRKLPYNNGENPYDVADRWLLNENLSLAYRQQVVDFILQNTRQTLPQINNTYIDPYTGANAYVPAQQPSWIHGSTNSMKETTASLNHIPKKGMLVFDTAQFDGIERKIVEFNASLEVEGHSTALLKENDMTRIKAMVMVIKDTSRYHASSFADADFNILNEILRSWPIQSLFPVLDLLRMMLLHPQAARWYSQESEKGRDVLIDAVRKANTPPIVAANQLTSARIVVNCFNHSSLKVWTVKHRNEILDIFSDCSSSSNKNVRLTYSTLVLNYAVLLTEAKDEEGQIQVLSAAMENAGSQESDAEVQFRALVAIGTLVQIGSVKRIAVDLDVRNIIDSALQSHASKVAEVGKELQIVLQ